MLQVLRKKTYLFGKIFWLPWGCKSRTLPLLCSLSLFKVVFVFRCCIDVAFLQRIGDVLPEVPVWWEGAHVTVRAVPQAGTWLQQQCSQHWAGATLPRRLHKSHGCWTTTSTYPFVDHIFRHAQFPAIYHKLHFSAALVPWLFTNWPFFLKTDEWFYHFLFTSFTDDLPQMTSIYSARLCSQLRNDTGM